MKIKVEKVKLDSAGIQELLKRSDTQAMIHQKAESVRSGIIKRPEEYVVLDGQSRSRCHSIIKPNTPHAYYSNLKHNSLLKALGGGGGND